MPSHELVAAWRLEAALERIEASKHSGGLAIAEDVTAGVLEDCANELERYHHHDAHNAAWEQDCPLCAAEMKEAGLEPL